MLFHFNIEHRYPTLCNPLKWGCSEWCQDSNINLADPDEVRKDGSGGLEGGDVGKGILWQDQPGGALPE